MAKTSVGLVIVTDLPGRGLVAVLQRRGTWNFEKMKPESWPGGCQVTAHGKSEGEEFPLSALRRESAEELGEFFVQTALLTSPHEALRDDVIEVDRQDGEEIVITYAIRLDQGPCRLIRLKPGSGGFCFVSLGGIESIQDLKKFDKVVGVTDRNTIAMFEDEKRAVVAALDQLGD